MVKGSIGDRILECIGYPESWTEQEIEDNKRVIQEEFSKIDSHVVKAVVARLCDKIEEPKIKKEKEAAERQEKEKKAEIARRIRMERSVRSTPWLCDFSNTYNERCDTLCQEAMTLPELEEDVGYMNTDSVPEQSDTVAQSLEDTAL